MEQISARRVYAYGRGDIIYAIAPRPCSRWLRGGRLDGKRVKAEVVLFLASLRDGGACLTLDLDPNHPLTKLLCCSRAPLVVRGRTQAHGCCLRHTHAPTTYHSSSQHQSCARPPGDDYIPATSQPYDRPSPKRVPFSLFHLALRDQ